MIFAAGQFHARLTIDISAADISFSDTPRCASFFIAARHALRAAIFLSAADARSFRHFRQISLRYFMTALQPPRAISPDTCSPPFRRTFRRHRHDYSRGFSRRQATRQLFLRFVSATLPPRRLLPRYAFAAAAFSSGYFAACLS